MRLLGVDTETCPILPGLLAPPLAVLSYSHEHENRLVSRQDVSEWAKTQLGKYAARNEWAVVGHNVAYDMSVLGAHDASTLPSIFRAYDSRAIYDTMLCEQLKDIADGELRKGGYSLEALDKRYQRPEPDKTTWRLKYGTLMDTPIEQWPQGAKAYALGDAIDTREIFAVQAKNDEIMVNAPEQAKYAFSQQLMCVWGIRTDPERVDALETSLRAEQCRIARELRRHGLLKDDPAGKTVKQQKRLQELVTQAYGGEPPTTGKGAVSIDKKTLAATKDPLLAAYSEYVANEKLLSTYLPVLREGTRVPINSSFRLLESGRRGASKNMQTPPKKEGVRECYVPRPGFVFCSCDYDSLELRALAQINLDLFGESPLADMYREDPNADPHTRIAAEMFMGISYEEGLRRKKAKDPQLKHFRQGAKAYNFGLPGGLGVNTFIQLAAAPPYNYTMTPEEAEQGKAAWIKLMRMEPFFEYVRHRTEFFGSITLPRSGRVRGGLGFCYGSNYLFQGPAADGACEAHYQVTKECYVVPESALYGCRVVNFMHDELIVEMPEWKASSAARRLSQVMNESMMRYLPDVPVTSSPTLMRRWSKSAEERYDESGQLQVWEAA